MYCGSVTLSATPRWENPYGHDGRSSAHPSASCGRVCLWKKGKLLWRQGWHCSAAAIFYQWVFGPIAAFQWPMQSGFIFVAWRSPRRLLVTAGLLAAWQPLQGFPLILWPLDDETLAPSVLTCSVLSHQAPVMETVSVARWHLSVTHESTIHMSTRPTPPTPTHRNHPWLTNNLLSPCL